jgi:FixJ family two-component response regulator
MHPLAYVVVVDPQDRAWIKSALAHHVELVFLENGPDLVAKIPRGPGHCLIVSIDEDEATTLGLARKLRAAGNELPIIVLGSYTAFRAAVTIARLDGTDILERPISVLQLLKAVRQAWGKRTIP